MANEKFKKALYDALMPEYVAAMREADNAVHEFSPEFEKRMKKLVKRRNKTYYNLINMVSKRAACIAAIFLIISSVSVISVGATQYKLVGFYINMYEDHAEIASADESGTAPLTIEDFYEITYDLSDYEVVWDLINEFHNQKVYHHKDIENVQIIYKQDVKHKYSPSISAEKAEITTTVINGFEAIYFLSRHNAHCLIWDNGEYVIEIWANIDKKEFFEMAESVKKVEIE